jgi:drug/metabolite transporter, DME family
VTAPAQWRGRLLIVAAAVLWSLSGAFTKLLIVPDDQLASAPLPTSGLGFNAPPCSGLVMAFFRALFAGLLLVPAVRRRHIAFRPGIILMAVCFAAMNASFVSAMAQGTAANAIFLQYTAPVWLYLFGVFLFHEGADRRQIITLIIAMTGVAVIVADAFFQPTWKTFGVVLLALVSGITYAGVLQSLRILRGYPGQWLTVVNHLAAAIVLLPVLFFFAFPTGRQVAFLALFGVVQMGIPYWLMSRGLHTVSAQEAGTLTLLEPLLNPVWAYLAAGEVPDSPTFIGGALILAALAWQYWPRRGESPKMAPN